MILELSLPICSIVFSSLLCCVYFFKRKVNLLENKMYSVMLVGVLLDSILVTIEKCLVIGKNLSDISNITYNAISIMNKIDACILIVITTCIFLYTVLVTLKLNYNAKKKLIISTVVTDIIMFIFIFLLNIKLIEHSPIISITGTSLIPTYIACGVYTFLSILVSLANIDKLTKKHVPLIATILVFVFLIIVFTYNPYLTIISILLTFINFIMYFTIENPDVEMINKLEYSKNILEKANKAKSDFLSSMSHELRTPLNSIIGLSQCIQTSDNIDEVHEDITDVLNSSNTLLEIVDGILDINKIESNEVNVKLVKYNPFDVFQSLIKMTNTRIGEKDIELKTRYDSNIPDELFGDKEKVSYILKNILENAVKYTEKGYIYFNVNCKNNKNKCNLVISIKDTGCGIKEEQLKRLFNKFERAEEVQNTDISGMGLGLAISDSLIKMLNGTITVNSIYGRGSEFIVSIPQEIVKTDSEKEKLKNSDINSNEYDNKKILIVDDNQLNIKVATKMLKENSFIIDSVLSGYECREKIKNGEHYDIIFMDIMMPDLSGVETLNQLKQLDNFNIPVIAFTADAMKGRADRYIELGFSDYLSKPINKEDLCRVLRGVFNEKLNNNDNDNDKDKPKSEIHQITDEEIEEINRLLAEKEKAKTHNNVQYLKDNGIDIDGAL